MSRPSNDRSSKGSTATSSSLRTYPGPLPVIPPPSPGSKGSPTSPTFATLRRSSRDHHGQYGTYSSSGSGSPVIPQRSPSVRSPSHRSRSTSHSTSDYGEVLRGTAALGLAGAAAQKPLPPQPQPQPQPPARPSSAQGTLTMNDVRERVAQDIALRAMRKAAVVDGTKVGVVLTLSKSSDEAFLRAVAAAIKRVLLLQSFLFAIATTPPGRAGAGETSSLIICGSAQEQVQRAVMLACSKFLSRVEEVHNEGTRWVGLVHDVGATSYDEAVGSGSARASGRG
jgi:hypothetical protein